MGGPIVVARLVVSRLALAIALALLACGRPASGTLGMVVVVDDAGDSVAVRAPATRVVSLIPATTELLFAIGAGASVVGRTQWCDYPAEALRVPDLGPGINPNLEAVLAVNPPLVGVNNRDLRTFVTDLDHTVRLSKHMPRDTFLVAESGIRTRGDVLRLQSAGVRGMLVGETLMRAPDIGAKIDELLGA